LYLALSTVTLLKASDGTHGIVELIHKLVMLGDEYMEARIELPPSYRVLLMAEPEFSRLLFHLQDAASLVFEVLMCGLEVLFLLEGECAPVVSITTQASCKRLSPE
jgi:hypothetical protein